MRQGEVLFVACQLAVHYFDFSKLARIAHMDEFNLVRSLG